MRQSERTPADTGADEATNACHTTRVFKNQEDERGVVVLQLGGHDAMRQDPPGEPMRISRVRSFAGERDGRSGGRSRLTVG